MSRLPSDESPRPRPTPSAREPAWVATALIPRARPESGHGNAKPVGTHLPEFELLRVLGEGGCGIVYLAQDHSQQRRMAIKAYMPASLAMPAGPLSVLVTTEKTAGCSRPGSTALSTRRGCWRSLTTPRC